MPCRKTMQTLTKITQSFVTGRQGHHIAVLFKLHFISLALCFTLKAEQLELAWSWFLFFVTLLFPLSEN